ncbi:MAG: methyltransferase domain-containing protein [Candidatus Lokiarchaeota archaeon]|nr:methyltransferase domain-containing protein [Candidatus Lokiarchaeota archaeon]
MSTETKIDGFKSIMYSSPLFYNFITQRLHNSEKKYNTLASMVCSDGEKKILDIPCGTGYLARFLKPNISYEGWDLNNVFLEKIKKDWKKGTCKPKNITLKQKDIFEYQDYPDVDCVLLCDILHHIFPKHKELVEKVKKCTKKVVICEPISISPENMNGNGLLGRLIMLIGRYLPESLIKIIDFLFGDNDGINSYATRSKWAQSDDALKLFYSKIGIKEEDIYILGDDLIGIWKKETL